jgi:hypothetical protein
MKKGIPCVGVVILALGCLPHAEAAPFQPARISASAAWYLHFDIEHFNSLNLGRLLQGENAPANVKRRLQRLQESVGIHLLRDIADIALFGEDSSGAHGVAEFSGRFNIQQIEARMAMHPGYRTFPSEKLRIHQWNDPQTGEPLFLCFFQSDLVLIASNLPLVQNAIAILEKRAPSMTSDRLPSGSSSATDFLVAAQRQNAGSTSFFGNVRTTSLHIAEAANGNIQGRLVLLTDSEPIAETTRQTVQGLILAATVAADQSPEWAAIARAATVETVKSQVIIRFYCPPALAVKLIDQALMPKASAARASGPRQP